MNKKIIDPLITEDGKIYINIHDIIMILKDMIEGGKLDGSDTALLEMLFVWFGKHAESLEGQVKQQRAARHQEHVKEVKRLFDKYGNFKKNDSKSNTAGSSNKKSTIVSEKNKPDLSPNVEKAEAPANSGDR